MPRQNTANSTSQKEGFSKIILLILGSFFLSSLALFAVLAIFNPLERLQPQNPQTQRPSEHKVEPPTSPSPSLSPQPTFQKSEENDYFADIANLPSCGDKKELFSLPPLQLNDFTTITPLGLLSPTAHVFPSQHLYFNVRRSVPGNYNSLPVEVPVVAPTNLTLTTIKFVEAKGRPDYDDSMIAFGICREVKVYFDHLKTLASKIKQAYEAAPIKRCDKYTLSYPQPVGNVEFNNCEKTVSLQIAKGEQMGTAGGGEGQKVFDFGVYDKRASPKQFANPSRWRGREHFVYLACSPDYYPADLRAQLKARLGGFAQKGEIRGVDCGEVIQDIPGTAMGAWVPPGTDFISHEPPYLALAHDYIEPQYLVFSMGESGKQAGLSVGKYTFLPKNEGFINRHFKDVKSNAQVYCFETEDTYQANLKPKVSILVTMPTPTKLQIQKLNSPSCGSGPWQMSNYAEFER